MAMTLAVGSPWLRAGCALCALCALAWTAPPGESKRDWIDRLSAAGTAMESALPALVADERYEQRRDGVRASPDTQRTLVSEFGWLLVPDLQTIGLRDIRTVDGEPVSNNEVRLRDLLAGRSSNAAADIRVLLAASARHNLGEAERNFNFPTFPLLYVRPANRERSKWHVDSRDPTFVTVRFEEHDRPTLVRSQQAAQVPAVGSCRLERRSFVLQQCTVTLTEDHVRGYDRAITYTMSVDFSEDPRLAVRVPVEMRDDLLIRFRRTKTEQRIIGVAAYRNYRRFETSGRLVRP
jgi:hypothetical protein